MGLVNPKRRRGARAVNRIVTPSKKTSTFGDPQSLDLLAPASWAKQDVFTGFVIQAASTATTTSPVSLATAAQSSGKSKPEELYVNDDGRSRWRCPGLRDPAQWYDGLLVKCTKAGQRSQGCVENKIYSIHGTTRAFEAEFGRKIFTYEFRPTQYGAGGDQKIIFANWWNPSYLNSLFQPLGYDTEPTLFERKNCNLQIISSTAMKQTEEVGSIYKITIDRYTARRKTYASGVTTPQQTFDDYFGWTETEPEQETELAQGETCYGKIGISSNANTSQLEAWNRCIYENDVDVFRRDRRGVLSLDATVAYPPQLIDLKTGGTRRRALSDSSVPRPRLASERIRKKITVVPPETQDHNDDARSMRKRRTLLIPNALS